MSALRLLTLLTATIFCGELAIMFALDYVAIDNELGKNALDATALVIIVFPFLYLFMFRTIIQKNKDLTAARQQLLVEQQTLERKIEERTNEIAVANGELKNSVGRLSIRRMEMTRLSEMVNFFQACRSLDEALGVAESQLRSLFPRLSGAFFLMNASHNILEKAVAWGPPIDMKSCHAPEDCWALRRGKAHTTGGTNGVTACRHLSADGDHCYICLPLLAHGEALGTLCLQIPEATAGEEDNGDRRTADRMVFYSAVAESLALAISNLRLRDTLRHQSIRDQLTGLYNRRYLIETLERELGRAAARDQNLTVAMLDADHFKRLNDTFGHAAGDAVLAKLGVVMREWKCSEDIVARYGGEEFAIILPDTSAETAFKRLDALRQTIGALAIEYRGQLLPPLTISGGFAAYPLHGISGDALINLADQALYKSKRDGRNRVTKAPDAAGLAQIVKDEVRLAPAPVYAKTA